MRQTRVRIMAWAGFRATGMVNGCVMSSPCHEQDNNDGVMCYPRHVLAVNGRIAKVSTPAFKHAHPVRVPSLRSEPLLKAPFVTLRPPLVLSYHLPPQ
jgi:hypothetical protein